MNGSRVALRDALAPSDVLGWSIDDHLDARRRGRSAVEAIRAVLDALHACDDPALLIGEPFDELALAMAAVVDAQPVESLPLHGVPFVVKDNLDIAGVATTCACPSWSRIAEADSAVVAILRAAGAIPVAKTNMDQFATGLVGTRSPFGTPRNPIDATLIPGGSSSGSAVAVARGYVPFSLGTDTAGSGRVPAAMCGIVGLKPTLGRFPAIGMVPAVRRIDCPTVFARSVRDARAVARVATNWQREDPYSKPPQPGRRAVRRVGVVADVAWLASVMEPAALDSYLRLVEVARASFEDLVPIDVTSFLEAGALLYGGTFVAERTAAVGAFLSTNPADADPTVRTIILGGNGHSAVEAYRGEYRLAELRVDTASTWDRVDALLLPTTSGVASVDDVAADRVGANSRMGVFTTFANLLDLAVIAFPGPPRTDGRPVGGQLIGPAWSDEALADAAQVLRPEEPSDDPDECRTGEVLLAVVGAHLRGMPLHHQLRDRHARFVSAEKTAPHYRLYALDGTTPPKPGLRRVDDDGRAIEIEIWALPEDRFGSFVAAIPAPLGIGSVERANGSWCSGFICEPIGLDAATDISDFGGWRAYCARDTDSKAQ